MYRKILITIFLIVIAAFVLFYFNYVNTKIVYIATSIPSTSTESKGQIRGIQMAFDEAQHRAGKYRVEWLPMDNSDGKGWNAEMERKNAEKAIANNDVVAYFGPYNSGAAKISMPILNKAGILQISIPTWPGLTRPGFAINEPRKFFPTGKSHFYRLIANDSVQGRATATYLKRRDVRTIAIISDDGVYGKGISAIFKSSAEDMSMQIVYTGEVIDISSKDVVVSKILSLKPDAVFFGSDTGPMIVQAYVELRSKGYGGLIIGSELKNTDIEKVASVDDPNLYTVVPGVPVKNQKNIIALGFYDKYVIRYKEDPTEYALYANQAMKIIFKAIENSNGSRKDVLLQMNTVKGMETAFGPLSFSSSGDLEGASSGLLHFVRGVWEFEQELK